MYDSARPSVIMITTGFDDISYSAWQSHLFRNNGNGTFKDVDGRLPACGPNEFSTSAAG